MNVPLGGSAKATKDGLTFGLTAQRSIGSDDTGVRANALTRSDAGVTASLVDIRYTPATRFFSRFTVGGVDALTYRTVHNADGTSSSLPFGLSPQTLILGAIVGAAIGYEI